MVTVDRRTFLSSPECPRSARRFRSTSARRSPSRHTTAPARSPTSSTWSSSCRRTGPSTTTSAPCAGCAASPTRTRSPCRPAGRCGTSRTARASCCRSGRRSRTSAVRSCRTRRTAGPTRTRPGTAAGTTSGAGYDERDAGITLRLRNPGRHRVRLAVRDRYGTRTRTRSLGPGETVTEQWSLSRNRGWYDLVVTVDGDPHFQRRYAGHVETGRESVTDPAMGGLV